MEILVCYIVFSLTQTFQKIFHDTAIFITLSSAKTKSKCLKPENKFPPTLNHTTTQKIGCFYYYGSRLTSTRGCEIKNRC